MTTPIDLERLRRLADCRVATGIDYHSSIDSTNHRAIALARLGATEGTVVLADEQTAGRGRGDHRWVSTRGLGVYVSVLLRPPATLLETPVFGVLGGAAAVHALRELTDVPFELKWPNDILIEGRKVGGILAEATAIGDGAGGPELSVVIGVGVNVHHDNTNLPTDTAIPATSLALEGAAVGRTEVIESILLRLGAFYENLIDAGVAPLEQAVTAVWRERGRWVGFEGGTAPEKTGRALSIDLAHGRIHLENRAGLPFDVDLTSFVRLRPADGHDTRPPGVH